MPVTREQYQAVITATTSGAIRELNQWDKSVEKSNKQFDKFAKSIGVSSQSLKAGLAGMAGVAIGGGIVAGIQQAADAFVDAAEGANMLAKTTNATIEDASRFNAVAQQMGLSMNDLVEIFADFQTAAQKNTGQLDAMGVELVKNTKGQVDWLATSVDFLTTIQGMGDATERTALMFKFFGEEGAKQLMQLVNSGKSVAQAMAEVTGTKLISDDDLQTAREYSQNMASLKSSAEGLGVALGRTLVPALSSMATVGGAAVDALGKVPPQLAAITAAAGSMAAVFLASNPLGWTVAAIAAVAALGGAMHNDLSEQVAEATDRLKELEDQGLSTADALKQTAFEVEASAGFWQNLWAAVEGSVSSGENASPVTVFQEIRDAMREGGRDFEKYQADLGATGGAAASLAAPVAEAGDAMKTLNDMFAAGVPDAQAYGDAVQAAAEAQAAQESAARGAASAVDAYRASTDLAWQATLNLVDAENATFDAHRALIDGIDAVGEARRRAREAEGRATAGPSQAERDRARQQVKDAEADLRAARKRVRDAKKEVGDAFTVGELREAKAALKSAQAAVDAARKRRASAGAKGPSAEERASARRTAEQARQDAKDAEARVLRLAQAQAAAVVAQKRGLAELKGETISLADEHDLYITSLEESKKLATTDEQRKAIQELIDKLKAAQKVAGEGIKIGKIRYESGTTKKQVDDLKTTIRQAMVGAVPWAMGVQAQAQLDSIEIPISIGGVPEAKDDLLGVTKGKDGKDRTAKVNVSLVGDALAKQKLDELALDRTVTLTYSIVPPTTPAYPPYTGLPRAGGQSMPSSLATPAGGPSGQGVNYAPTIVNNYPKPERASDSIASSLRVARYLSGV